MGWELTGQLRGTKSVCKYHKDTRSPNRGHHEQNVHCIPFVAFADDLVGDWQITDHRYKDGVTTLTKLSII